MMMGMRTEGIVCSSHELSSVLYLVGEYCHKLYLDLGVPMLEMKQ